jgi:hypothetical protein
LTEILNWLALRAAQLRLRRKFQFNLQKAENDVSDLATRCARVVHLALAPMEGVGNAGCPLHPQPRVRSVESTRVFTTVAPGSPGIPARNGFNGLCRALPGDRALLPLSSADIVLSKPGWADATPRT